MNITNPRTDQRRAQALDQGLRNHDSDTKKLAYAALAGLTGGLMQQIAAEAATARHRPVNPSDRDLKDFCTALISDNDATAQDIITDARVRGAGTEMICRSYLAAAARLLGVWWIEDRIGFAEVSVGTGRMFAMLRGSRHNRPSPSESQDVPVIFATVPGEEHSFGVCMAAELFRRDGWDIILKIGLNHDELVSTVARSASGVVGLSISGWHSLGALSRLVGSLRASAPNTAIFLSGQSVEDLGPFLSILALDGVASDIDDAKEQISALWEAKTAGSAFSVDVRSETVLNNHWPRQTRCA